ncbi:MAG: glycosyltransferase family 4 protein [Chryseolinea sp.]
MAKKHVVYIVSHIHKSLAFEWIVSGLRKDIKFTFILLNPSGSLLEDFLIHHQINVKRITYRNKKDFIPAFLKTFFFLLFKRPQIVHAHLLDAQLIGLTAAWFAGIRKRIYTRHNSNYHHVYHPQGVKFDLWSNKLATHIISISQATDVTLHQLENASASKIIKIPHGFDLNLFAEVPAIRVDSIKAKWNIPADRPIVGVIARHIEWKGIQFIIPAFKKFLEQYPTATLVLANASGPYHETLLKLLSDVQKNHIVLIPFEEDVTALYPVFDMYVHTPVDSLCEAFGQTYCEALAAGIPSIFTPSGIGAEFIQNEKNALLVDFQNSDSIYKAMINLWGNPELRNHLIKNGRQDVFSKFGLDSMLNSLKKLYDA